ncbi:MAG: hypothetical protein AAFQ05_16030, partial [Pseudomonadota bacterium]
FSGQVPSGLDLGAQDKAVLTLPFRAGDVGDHEIRVALTTPDGKQLVKEMTLGVRSNDPEVAVTRRFSLGASRFGRSPDRHVLGSVHQRSGPGRLPHHQNTAMAVRGM